MQHEPIPIHDLAILPAPATVFPGMLPEKGIIILQGMPGSFKSFYAIELAVAGATMTSAFGKAPPGRQIRTLYVGSDSPAYDIGQQARKLCAGRGVRTSQLLAHGEYGYVKEEVIEGQTVAHRMPSFMVIPDAKPFLRTEVGATELRSIVESGSYGLVVLDTLQALHEQNGNDWALMQTVMNRVKMLRELACVLVIHHTPKPSQGVTRVGVDNTSGSRPIAGGADAVVELRTHNRGEWVEVLVPKSRGLRLDEFHFNVEEADEEMRFSLREQPFILPAGVQELMRDGKPHRFMEIVGAAGGNTSITQALIRKGMRHGMLKNPARGVYFLRVT